MSPELLALSIIVLLFSVIVHEVMHGFVALKFGDHTAERAGRLTLNPIPHIDLQGSILLPFLLFYISSGQVVFGYAKPVPVNPLNFTNLRRGELVVSSAGILANLGLAIIFALLFRFVFAFNPSSIIDSVGPLLIYSVRLNVALAFFNLLPVPPLDGSKILESQLPFKQARMFERFAPYGFLVLMLLVFLGPINLLFSFVVNPITRLLLGV